MKLEKYGKALAAVLLAALISRSAVGCLATGFDLALEAPELLWAVCSLAALAGGFCFLYNWGTAAVLCLLAVWTGYQWYRGEAGLQILLLIQRISTVYDGAYGWGVLWFADTAQRGPYTDLPLQIIGIGIALCVSFTVCRGTRTWPSLAVSAVPLLLCLVVTDTVPAEKWLFALLLGLVLLALTGSVRRFDREQAAKLTWMLALPVAVFLSALFLLIPQDDYVNRAEEARDKVLGFVESLPEKAEAAAASLRSGDDTGVDLKNLGPQNSLQYPVMEVTSDFGGVVYLRQQDYDSYTGTGWTASRMRSEAFGYPGEDAGSVRIRTRTGRDSRFLPYYPREAVTLVGGSGKNEGRDKEYTVSRCVLPDNWRSLVRQRSQGHWESEIEFTAAMEASRYLDSARYLFLPMETGDRARELLVSILSGEGSATDEAETIAAYVRSRAKYDKNTGRMPQDEADFALWFLEDSETGYCVHFATAAVVLLRAANIPARYVTGYMVTCQAGETVTVTADTAHAWAEYYEPQLACWIPLEATPSDGLPRTHGTEPAVQQQEQPVRPTESQSRPEPDSPLPTQTEGKTQGTVPNTQKKPVRVPAGLVAAVAVALLMLLQRRARLTLRRLRLERSGPNDRALALWQEAVRLAKLRREPVPNRVKALAQKAKFSQHTLTDEELGELEDYISGSLDALEDRPWYLRLVYRYIFAAY